MSIFNTMYKFLIFIAVSFIFSNTLFAQSDTNLYSFFIAGHTSGKTGINNIVGIHPPFKEKFTYIQNRQEIKFGVFTGDIVSPHPEAEDWDEVDVDIDSLGLPVYFAVGNHDMENRPLYESRYGITYYYFLYENDLFIILDPNIDGWSIKGEQLEFLENVLENNSQSVDNIFVFFHQLLWKPGNSIYVDIKPNSYTGIVGPVNFYSVIEPIFYNINKPVMFFAGDVGAGSWSSDFMYDSYSNITFIASGMGEGVGDNFIIINVSDDKSISYDLICLNDTALNCFGELRDYQISPVCLNNGFTFNSQLEVDQFHSNFPNCNTIEGNVIISGHDIQNIDSLQYIKKIEGNLIIKTNPIIENLKGLRNIQLEIDTLIISQNDLLEKLSGLDSLNLEFCHYIDIQNNPNLAICSLKNICTYLINKPEQIIINNNAEGCNDIVDLNNTCNTSIAELSKKQLLLILPNPVINTIQLLSINSSVLSMQLSISILDITGTKIDEFDFNQISITKDVSNYPAGLYIIVIRGDGAILETHRMIKE